jgi:quercetin dioxygenase-like cupin family protein
LQKTHPMHPKEVITVGQIQLTFLLDGEDTKNESVLFEMVIPYGAKIPAPHYHVGVDEIVYGLEGVTTSTVNSVSTDLKQGDHLFIPRGAVHHHENLHNGVARSLCVLTPASIGPAYFRELVAVLKKGTPPNPKEMSAVMAKHGLVVAAHPVK